MAGNKGFKLGALTVAAIVALGLSVGAVQKVTKAKDFRIKGDVVLTVATSVPEDVPEEIDLENGLLFTLLDIGQTSHAGRHVNEGWTVSYQDGTSASWGIWRSSQGTLTWEGRGDMTTDPPSLTVWVTGGTGKYANVVPGEYDEDLGFTGSGFVGGMYNITPTATGLTYNYLGFGTIEY